MCQGEILCEVAAACLNDRSSVSVVDGAPGTGKTSILMELTILLAIDRKKVLICSADDATLDYIAAYFAFQQQHNQNEAKLKVIVFGDFRHGELTSYESFILLKRLKANGVKTGSKEYHKILSEECNTANIVITNFAGNGLVDVQR